MAIFLRRGESEANIKGLFAGQREDSSLSAKGSEQARAAGEDLQVVVLSQIITSPLKRTLQTAEQIASIVEFDPEDIIVDERIVEYDMGALTGTPIRKITSKELVSAEDAEDPYELEARVLSFLKDHKDAKENILMVSHAGVGRIIESAKQGLDPREFYNLKPYPNGRAVKLDLDWLA